MSNGPALLAYLLFAVFNVVSSVSSGNAESISRSLTFFVAPIFYLLSYHIVHKDFRNLSHLVWAIVIGGAFVATAGALEVGMRRPIIDILNLNVLTTEDWSYWLSKERFGLEGRIVSFIGQPVYAGFYYGVWLMTLAYYFIVYKQGLAKMAMLVAIPSALGLMIMTGSRGPLMALVPTLFALAALSQRKVRTVAIVGLLSLFVAVAVSVSLPTLPSYLRASLDISTWSVTSANALGRIELTRRMWRYFLGSPILGVGAGYFKHQQVGGLTGTENQYATILAEGGIFAISTYVAFQASTFCFLLGVFRHSSTPAVKYGGLLTLLLFVFYSVFTLSASCMTQTPYLVIMSLYGAVTAASAREVRGTGGSDPGSIT